MSSADGSISFVSDPLAIAIFIPSFRGGGAERAMLLFAEGLVAAGQRVDLLVLEESGPLRQFLSPRVRLINLNRRRAIQGILPLVSYLRRERPFALYSTIAHLNVLSILAVKLARVPTRVVVRESNVPVTEPKRTLSRRVVSWMVPFLYPWSDAIIAVSQDVATELCLLNPRLQKKISILPTPVVSSELIEGAKETPGHQWFNPGEPPVILGAGRLHPQKDFTTLLRAFAIVRRERAVRLIILGEGEERSALEALAAALGVSDSVSMPGFVANPFSYMHRASVFVLSSRHEGMANVLLQALACGTPVVATDCKGGCREVLRDGLYGKLVPVGDTELMASGMAASLELPKQAEIAEKIRMEYGVETAAIGYLSCIIQHGQRGEEVCEESIGH